MQTIDFTTTLLLPWESGQIKQAFIKYAFLQDIISDSDSRAYEEAIQMLSEKTGFRKQFLKNHLEEIKKL